MIDAAIFDMDGLMFDTQRLYDQMWEPACAEQGVPCIRGMVEDTRGTNGENMWAAIRKYYGDTVDPAELWAANKRHTFAALEKHVPKRPGLDELLTWLDEHDVPMAVASSTEREHVLRNLEGAGVRRYFKSVICGDMVKLSKPDPDTLHIDSSADCRMRGAAGEAVHILNLMCGLHERTGLALKAIDFHPI